MSGFQGFPAETLVFLSELSQNNNREWFAANKHRYEASVLEPALELIHSLKRPLSKVAPLLHVEAKRAGGSLMRIYKDTRFSTDKTPYKTNIGIQFRHTAGKDVHAPGIYLHISPEECFFGAGMWRPDSAALSAVRGAIETASGEWQRAMHGKRFRERFEIYEDRLKTAPRGVDKNHPLIESLRLKSFLGTAPLSRDLVESADLVDEVLKLVKVSAPLMAFLCAAVDQPY